ncbi:MAG TPA: adenylate/guanylate cyclase domain-containing protein [Candidatus Binataceae bacterium]|nr:adenylate/guanylate cyclase domain-containing protein [Candidatus Binataceae bacterium]
MADRPNPAHETLLHRFGNPLDWNPAHRCTLISLIGFSFTVWTVFIAHYLMSHPATAPYVSRPVLELLLRIEEEFYLSGWLILAALGLLLGIIGERRGGTLLLSSLISGFYVIHVLTVGYCIGLFTAIYFGAALMAGLTVGMLLLEPRPVIIAEVSLIAGFVALTIAVQLRVIPYAPLLLQAPFKDGQFSGSWIATFGGFDFTLLIGMFGLALLVMQRLQTREHQLTEANRFLTRFLSPQVARIANELGMASVLQKSRSQLTAIECDLRGFTAFSESVAPEEVVDLLERYYAAIGEAVSEFGGIIKDYSGDGVLVLVGAPVAYPDHARRAVSIAFKIRERVTELLSSWQNLGLELKVGVGLASGYVTVGAIGGAERLEYVAVGSAVNLASRLCERATNSILVDQRAVSLVGNDDLSFHFEQLESADLKGFSRPVKVFELIAANGLAAAGR